MKFIIRKLREWHWLHTWSQWTLHPNKGYVVYPWTLPGHYNHTVQKQTRTCTVCGKNQTERV